MLRNGAWLRPGAEATSAVPPQSGPASLGQLDSAARPRPSHTDAQPRGVQVTVPGPHAWPLSPAAGATPEHAQGREGP